MTMTTYDKLGVILETFDEEEINTINDALFDITKKHILNHFGEKWAFRYFATKDEVTYGLDTERFNDIKNYIFKITVGKYENIVFTSYHNGKFDMRLSLDEKVVVRFVDIAYRKIKINKILG
jgi:hypothetical protein